MRAATRLLSRPKAGQVFAGYDVARKRDLAVLTLFERSNGVLTCIAQLAIPDCPFQEQETLLRRLTPLLTSGCIDETGLGMNLAENMHRHNSKWKGVLFTAPMKAQLAGDLREHFQSGTILIPPDRELQRDLHSVQRVVTAANNIVFNADREEGEGHADRFWSVALAVHAARRAGAGVIFRAVGAGARLDPAFLQDLRIARGEVPQTIGQRRKKAQEDSLRTDQAGRVYRKRGSQYIPLPPKAEGKGS